MRAEYLDSQKDKSFVSLNKARAKRLATDWRQVSITRPSFLGTRVFNNFDLNQVLPYIDWDPFFSTWQIRGKYPNRTYPKIFNDRTVGVEAKKLFDNAQVMLRRLIDENLIEARGIVGFYPCNTVDLDDVAVMDPEDPTQEKCRFMMLRQ